MEASLRRQPTSRKSLRDEHDPSRRFPYPSELPDVHLRTVSGVPTPSSSDTLAIAAHSESCSAPISRRPSAPPAPSAQADAAYACLLT